MGERLEEKAGEAMLAHALRLVPGKLPAPRDRRDRAGQVIAVDMGLDSGADRIDAGARQACILWPRQHPVEAVGRGRREPRRHAARKGGPGSKSGSKSQYLAAIDHGLAPLSRLSGE